MLTRAALLTSAFFASLIISSACVVNTASADETSAATFASAPKLSVSKTELINVGGWTLDRIRADAGCNKLAGTYRAGSGKIITDLAITTRMSCDDAKNRADAALSELFTQTFKAELRQTEPMRMRLIGENGDVLMFVAMPLSF
jgi:heat shock protein HslJ